MADVRRIRSLGFSGPGDASLFEFDEEPVGAGDLQLTTLYSGFSAGTELTFFTGTNPYLTSRWDEDLGVFSAEAPSSVYPIRSPGYMEVAQITESRDDRFSTGQIVAAAYGHKSHHVADGGRDAVYAIGDLDPLLGIYVAQMGPICANGLLHAAAERSHGVVGLGDGVAGERVLVVGGGVVGLLTALFARHHGAAEVVVLDASPVRRAAAEALGATSIDDADGEGWRRVKQRWRRGAGDCGADVAFQCRGQASALAAALRSVRAQATVVDLAFYQGGADGLRLGDEFHHNGLVIRCAQIGRVPRGLAEAWDRDRLVAATLEMLHAHGASVRDHLITDVVPLADGAAVIADLAARRRQAIQIVFQMTE